MAVDTVQLPCLETLPTEILHLVVGRLFPWQIKQLSCTSKRLRLACLPLLFRKVRFDFSRAGVEALEAFSKSNTLSHVTSFTYNVTQVLKSEILDFDRFRSDILTPGDYVDAAKDHYDAGYDSDDFPSYMDIYESTGDIWKEQRSIVDEDADLILSLIFCKLPLLREVRLCFGEALEDVIWLLNSDVLFEDEFYLHHLQVVTSAIQNAQRSGIAIDTVSLRDFTLPYYYSWETPDLNILSQSLRQLLGGVEALHLRGSACVLELLSDRTLHLRRLDMCQLTTTDTTLTDFLQMNKEDIRSIGFHEVNICSSTLRLASSHLMTANLLRSMLDLPQYTACEAAQCGCILRRNEGSRLVVGVIKDGLVDHSGTSPKEILTAGNGIGT